MYLKHTVPVVMIAAALVGPAACSHSSGTTPGAAASSAHARVSSAMANPTVSADLTTLENNLTLCLKQHAMSLHPVQDTLACAFPNGDTKVLERFALDTFTPAVARTRGPGSARDEWVQGVAAKALATEQVPSGGGSTTPAASPKVSS
jgi:hypothetical protein